MHIAQSLLSLLLKWSITSKLPHIWLDLAAIYRHICPPTNERELQQSFEKIADSLCFVYRALAFVAFMGQQNYMNSTVHEYQFQILLFITKYLCFIF